MRRLVVVFFLGLVLSLAGCSDPLASVEAKIQAHARERVEQKSQVETVSLSDIPSEAPKEKWSVTFSDILSPSITPDGERVVAYSNFGTSSRPKLGFNVYDKEGNLLWNQRYSSSYQGGWARVLGEGGYVGSAVYHYNKTGNFYLYDINGKLLFSRAVFGPINVAMSSGGLVLLDYERERLYMLDLEGRERGSFRISKEAMARFVPGTDYLLVLDRDGVYIINQSGRKLLENDISPGDIRDVSFSPDGSSIAITTGNGDSRLYLFDLKGELLWDRLLLPGGRARILFDSDRVLVYDVGDKGGVNLYSAADGEMLFSYDFLPAGGERLDARKARFIGDGEVAVCIVEYRVENSITFEDHYLVVLGEDEVRVKMPLGENVDYALSADGRRMVTGTNSVSQNRYYVRNRLTYYDFEEP